MGLRRVRKALAVDLVVHFVKSKGQSSPKVFKVGSTTLGSRQAATFEKSISLAVHTTRTPYPGRHAVEALINGQRYELGAFVMAG